MAGRREGRGWLVMTGASSGTDHQLIKNQFQAVDSENKAKNFDINSEAKETFLCSL
jgi:hypothetical protein